MTRRIVRVAWCAALAASLTPSHVGAQQASMASRIQDIRRAIAAGDNTTAVRVADSLVVAIPGHPNTVFIRAVALGAAGRMTEAERDVRQLLAWDARYARRALMDTALAALRDRVGAEVNRLAERAELPVARAQAWAILEERDLVPEGTAWDPVTRAVLVGSLNKNKIIAIGEDGTVSNRVAAGAHGLGSVVGIHVDAARRTLWVASNARYDRQTDTTRAALYAFDVSSGAFKARYDAPADGAHFLNDITTAPDGSVFVTDTRAGAVWHLRRGATALERYSPARVTAPNGITMSSDGRHLFVADEGGVWVVVVSSGERWRLTAPDSVNLTGVDGLAFHEGALIAHHPLAFWRVARYPLDRARRSVTGREVIERNTPHSRTSTTGEVAGGSYVFIGNSQIDRMNAGTLDSTTMDRVAIYRVSLSSAPGGRVAVALSGRDSVALFDAISLDRVSSLGVGKNPHEIAAARDGRRVFVANAGATSISVIGGGPTPRVEATWTLPDSISVHDVLASTDGRTVWAASGARLVIALDAGTGRITRRYPLSRSGSWMIADGGATRRLVVSHLEGGAVSLLDPATGRERILEGREGEIDAAVTADGREIWSVNVRNDSLTVFDAAAGTVVQRTRSGPGAGRVIFTPGGGTALVVHGGDSTVVAYDVRTKQRIGVVTVPSGPKVIALSADGRRAYVTHPDRGALTMIDVPAMAVLRSVALPGAPDGVAVIEP